MFGEIHRHYEEIDSTNRVALDWNDAPHGALVSADSQTNGRGRLGRKWESPSAKGLYFSVITRPKIENRAIMALVAALALAKSLESSTNLNFKIKWPNDLLCRGQKIGGLLCESRDERTIVGIGLNLTHQLEDLPTRPLFPASSLLLLGGQQFSGDWLLPAILQTLEGQFERLENGDWPRLKTELEARLWGVGEIVRVGEKMGILRGLDNGGHLQIHTSNGLESVVAGDVSWV